MFKVVDQGGFTNILCSETGKLICQVRGNGKVDVGCPIPSPRKCPVQKVAPIRRAVKPDLICRSSSVDEDLSKPNSDTFEVKEIPKPAVPEVTVTEDYFDDCINQEEFMRCLGAIPTRMLVENKIEELSHEFSVRWISRSRPAETCQPLPDIKIFEDADLCSPLGEKLLASQLGKNYINDSAAMMSIKKYDGYCRFALSSTNLSGCNFPKLRCREMKMYPLTFRPHKSRKNNCHMYSFNKRERLERIKTIKAGLDKNSRELKRMCSAKTLFVVLTRITEDEIKTWTTRKPRPPQVIENSVTPPPRSESPDIEIISVIKGNSRTDEQQSVLPGPKLQFAHSIFMGTATAAASSSTPTGVNKNAGNSVAVRRVQNLKVSSAPSRYSYIMKLITAMQQQRCVVKLWDVANFMSKGENGYVMNGSKIRIGNPELIADKLRRQKNTSGSVLPPHHSDHMYHRIGVKLIGGRGSMSLSSGQPTGDTAVTHSPKHLSQLQSLLILKNAVGSKGYLANPLRPESLLKKNVPTPIIDLTLDEEIRSGGGKPSPNPMINTNTVAVVTERYSISSWVFQCFGCGHKRKFPQKAIADSDVLQHMRNFHSVTQPELFLSSHVDTVNRTVIIEAFPGYKTNLT